MKFRFILSLIGLAALSRLLPHPPNFTALGAVGLLGAATLERKYTAFLIPFAALFLSDLLINNIIYRDLYQTFTWFTGWSVYIAFALVILAGRIVLFGKLTPARIVFASLTGSTIFFLVTNFWLWYAVDFYPKTAAGLAACYTAAIPFFGNTILGDLFYGVVLFGVYSYVAQKNPTWSLNENN